MIKLVVSDMDGTLLNNKASISQKNLLAIKRLQEKNIEFAIASGRDYEGVYRILNQFNIQCNAILGNGAQYVDKEGNILMDCYLDKSVYKDIIKVFEDLSIHYLVFTTMGPYSGYDIKEVREAFILRGCHRFNNKLEEFEEGGSHYYTAVNFLKPIINQDNFLKEEFDIIKVEAFCEDISKIEAAKQKLKNISSISFLSSFDDNVEVTNLEAQKGLILKKVIQMKNHQQEDVVVIGDGMNDLTLFEGFTNSYAPQNADEHIKSLAYRIVSDCEDDAVAEVIDLILKDLEF